MTKRCGLVFWLLLTLMTLGSCAGAVRNSIDESTESLSPGALGPEVRALLKNGDWLLQRGFHRGDRFIAAATNMPLSHAGIYDAGRDEVIESAGRKGVHISPLNDFIGRSQRLMIIRPHWSGPESSALAVERARAWVGQNYNYTGLVGLNTPEAYYCTQLAIEAYRPFIGENPPNPIPKVIAPGQMHHWGRIVYDSGP